MKKIFFLLTALLLFLNPVFAINWLDITTSNNKYLLLDTDSIKEFQSYYFYNIKTKKNNGEEVIITMQFQKKHPFGARIKFYTNQVYEQLNGDYENITKNMTDRLEPVSFESRAFASYKKVNEIVHQNDRPQITF